MIVTPSARAGVLLSPNDTIISERCENFLSKVPRQQDSCFGGLGMEDTLKMALEDMTQVVDGPGLHRAMVVKILNGETDSLSEHAVPRVAGRLAPVSAILCDGTQPLYRLLYVLLCREQFI